MWAFVLQAIIDSMIPGIIEFRSKNAELYRKKNRRLYALVFYFAAAVSLCISILAKPLVLILYGQQYAPAIVPLRIVVWYTAFSYLGVARNAWIVCENRQKYLKHLYIAAAVINVVLNWVLIPRWGATGAATASLLTQISTTIFLPAIIRPLQPNVKLMAEAIMLRKIK
jgi:O-antigen/teichoic acid export membrane protein